MQVEEDYWTPTATPRHFLIQLIQHSINRLCMYIHMYKCQKLLPAFLRRYFRRLIRFNFSVFKWQRHIHHYYYANLDRYMNYYDYDCKLECSFYSTTIFQHPYFHHRFDVMLFNHRCSSKSNSEIYMHVIIKVFLMHATSREKVSCTKESIVVG